MDPTFSNVYSMVLMAMQCPQCHQAGGVFGSPDFSSKDKAYTSLVGKDASTMNPPGQCSGMGELVVPGDCDNSLLYDKISRDMPKCGRRMPLSSTTVTQAGIDLVCAWIKAGAKQD
jgi:hypothetical protein